MRRTKTAILEDEITGDYFLLYLTTLEIVYTIIRRITKLRKMEKIKKSYGSVKL